MDESVDRRLAVLRDYLRRKGADPDLAPVFLEELKTSPINPWPRLIELALAGVGIYSALRWLIHIFLRV